MQKSAKSSLRTIFFLIVVSLSYNTLASDLNDQIKDYDLQRVDLLTAARFYQANGNLTASGNSYDALPSGYAYQIWQFDFGARGALTSGSALFANTTLSSSQSKAPSDTRKNTNISDLQIGTDFLFYQKQNFALAAEISLNFATEENDFNSDVVAVSDGVSSLYARAIAQNRGPSFTWSGYTGVHYKDRGLATLLLYGGLAQFNFKSSHLGFELNGYSTLISDTDSSESARNSYQCRANGCAKKFAAYNPSILEGTGYWKWKMNQDLQLKLSLGSTITGSNAAYGYQAGIMLSYSIPSSSSDTDYTRSTPVVTEPQLKPSNKNPDRRRVVEPKFQEETDDGVDQSLFEPPPPPKPRPAQPRVSPQEQIQNALDKTEMQIELKSSKKKKR